MAKEAYSHHHHYHLPKNNYRLIPKSSPELAGEVFPSDSSELESLPVRAGE
jgi:hypothetical protein